MTPKRIIQQAKQKGLDIIAISDHNSAENIPAALSVSEEITVLPAMEITTSEEAHIIALMPEVNSINELQRIVYSSLPEIEQTKRFYSEQVIVDENDFVKGFNRRLLINATEFSTKELIEIIHELGGLAVACHIDREVFSILTQLGFIPPELKFDALEISFRTSPQDALMEYQQYRHYPWIRSSDAHTLNDIGKVYTEFVIKEPTFEEIKLAFKGQGTRQIKI
jgi:hypothetical protein